MSYYTKWNKFHMKKLFYSLVLYWGHVMSARRGLWAKQKIDFRLSDFFNPIRHVSKSRFCVRKKACLSMSKTKCRMSDIKKTHVMRRNSFQCFGTTTAPSLLFRSRECMFAIVSIPFLFCVNSLSCDEIDFIATSVYHVSI